MECFARGKGPFATGRSTAGRSGSRGWKTMKLQGERTGATSIVVVVALLIAVIGMMPSEMAVMVVKEHGPVELLTSVAYLVAAVWLFGLALKRGKTACFPAAFVILLLGMREMDFHSKFTTMGVFKTRYYISPEVPMGEKAVVTIIMIGILYVAFRFVAANFKPFIFDLRNGRISSRMVAMAIGFGVVSKIFDSMSGPIRKVVAIFHSDPRTFLRGAEETLELAIPFFILLAIYHWYGESIGRDNM